MKKLFLILSSVIMVFFVQSVQAATIYKIKGRKAIVKINSEAFSRREKVYIYGDSDKVIGKAEVIKVKTNSMLIKKISGRFSVGDTVSTRKRGGYMADSTTRSVRGYLGFAKIKNAEDNPLPLGIDYIFKASWMDWMKDYDVLAGLLFWNSSGTYYKIDVKEFAMGVEKKIPFKSFFVIYGGRVGMSLYEVTTAAFLIGTTSKSSTEFFISPHGGVEYNINSKFSVGGEVRLPYYITTSDYGIFDLIYFLGSARYKF